MPSSKVIYRQQLCWKCEKADGSSDCPWANKLQPVEGWTANKVNRTKIEISGRGKNRFKYRRKIKSFEIIACPLFERDKPRRKLDEENS